MRTSILALLLLAVPAAAREDEPNPVDRYFDAAWKSAGIKPGPTVDDYDFLRRASLDVTGRLPRPEEIRAVDCWDQSWSSDYCQRAQGA